MKKSFILHYDKLSVLDTMTDAQAWKLFKKIKSYHNGNDYVSDDPLVDAVFVFFKNQFDADNDKREKVKKARSEAGKKWWRPKKQTKAKKANGFSEKQTKAKKAVTVTVTGTGTVTDTGTETGTETETEKDTEKYFDHPPLNDAFLDFIEFRKSTLKKPMTEKAIKLMVNKINRFKCWDGRKVRSIEESIMNNRTWVFEKWPDKRKGIEDSKRSASKQRSQNYKNKKQEPTLSSMIIPDVDF